MRDCADFPGASQAAKESDLLVPSMAVEQEPTLVWRDAGLAFEPALEHGKRPQSRKQLRKSPPGKRTERHLGDSGASVSALHRRLPTT
jgi:hypothetical protein